MFRHFRFREVHASTFTADVKWYFSSRTKATLKQYNATCENSKCPRRFEYYVVKRNSDEWKMAVDVTNARFVIFRDNLIDAIPHWWLA
uniref:Transposase MuDR plant domain-containing protein n=1 Tax=Acrobeloides nanus TaxID=290746 RepID=A0A914CBC4_9BILA